MMADWVAMSMGREEEMIKSKERGTGRMGLTGLMSLHFAHRNIPRAAGRIARSLNVKAELSD